MSKSTSLGYTDTADGGVTTKSFTRQNLNYAADFVATERSANKVVASNKTSPVDQLETIRIQSTRIADVYKGSSINPAAYAANREGISIVAQVNDIARVSESTDATYQVDLPISAHVVVKAPLSANITADQVMNVIGRAVSLFFNSNDATSALIANMLRGSVTPTGLV